MDNPFVCFAKVISSDCAINSEDSTKLLLTVNQAVPTGSLIRITVGVLNPIVTLTADLHLQTISHTTNRTAENGIFPNALKTSSIVITKKPLKFLWGLSPTEKGIVS
jgi:hypothetical protein